MTICKFFNTPNGCRFGADCPFEHSRESEQSEGQHSGSSSNGVEFRGRGRPQQQRQQQRRNNDDAQKRYPQPNPKPRFHLHYNKRNGDEHAISSSSSSLLTHVPPSGNNSTNPSPSSITTPSEPQKPMNSSPHQNLKNEAQRQVISRPVVKRPAGKSLEERLKATSDPHERAALIKEQELSQVERRYRDHGYRVTLRSDPSSGRQIHLVSLTLIPTDPDFPFDLSGLELQLNIPALYPIDLENLYIRVKNAEIPENLKRNVETSFKRKLRASRISLLSMLSWLDQNLESLLVATPSSMNIVSMVSNKQTSSSPQDALETNPSRPTCDDHQDVDESEDDESYSNSTFSITDSSDNEESENIANSMEGLTLQNNDNAPYGIAIRLPDIHMEHISLLTLSDLCIAVRCSRCKNMNSIDHLKPCPVGRENDIESGTFDSCSACKQTFFVRFRPHVIHQSSRDIGYLDVNDCVPFDLLPCSFDATCEHCLTKQLSAFSRVHRGVQLKYQCHHCHITPLYLRMESVEFVSVGKTLFSRNNNNGDSNQVHDRQEPGGSLALKRAKKKKPRDDIALVLGHPLPKKGTCEHYKKSYRWLRFPCCGKLYPCDICHEIGSTDGHEMKWATRMVCGFCSKEQAYSQTPCACGHHLTKQSGKRFWEGGSGVRDQSKMSKRDSRKYRGTLKTISRRAMTSGSSK